ncbi:MAG: diguanylate cyclase [Pseudohongiella sp.]|nr:diguanylate cyclase [Pseudohongiella sp.]
MNDVSDLHDDVRQQHILFQLLQTLDNGLILLNSQYEVMLWNGFMENHSGIPIGAARGKSIFDLFPNLPKIWLTKKIDSVFRLQIRAFCTWEEHPRLFEFKSTRPLSGHSLMMYQNVTMIPLLGLDSKVSQVCLQIYDVTEIATRKIALESANLSLQRLSRTDRLTGINNRGFWEENLEQEFLRCHRSHRPASLIMLDIDHFKHFNDMHGHSAGDEVLRAVSNQIKKSQRTTDIAGRYGGEEFAIILPDTDGQQALAVAERLKQQISKLRLEWQDQSLTITVSMGISEYNQSMSVYQEWIDHADAALYKAKAGGRNLCVLADPFAQKQ